MLRLCTPSLLLGLAILSALPLLGGAPAQAQGAPRSVSDCERLKNDLAYNQCLAMFGPAAKNVASGVSSGAASASAEVAAAARAPASPSRAARAAPIAATAAGAERAFRRG